LRSSRHAQDAAMRQMRRCFWRDRSLAERPRGGPDAQHVSLPQRSALEPAQPAQDGRRGAPQKRLHIESTLHAKIAACSRVRRTQAKRLARPHFDRSSHLESNIIERRAEIGACQRQDRSIRERKCSTEQHHLQPGGVLIIPNQSVAKSQRDAIGRAGRRNTCGTKAVPSQILHCGLQAGGQHLNRAHRCSSAANCAAEIGVKRTRSPIERKLIASRSARNIAMGVRPINRQPPGVANGYTPVWLPAIPTLPGGVLRRGRSSRGVASACGNSPKYAKPGTNPRKYTMYVTEACNSITASGVIPRRLATSPKSGPNSPP